MADRRDLGRRAEEAAVEYLRQRRHVVVGRNVRSRFGELDLITTCGDTLVFVEVRSKSALRFGRAIETIDRRKRLRIARLAEHYLMRNHLEERRVRFDVIGVTWRDDIPEIDHIENAFEVGD
jgi:putative endonuclease